MFFKHFFEHIFALKAYRKNPRICSTGLETGCKPVLLNQEYTRHKKEIIKILKENNFFAKAINKSNMFFENNLLIFNYSEVDLLMSFKTVTFV